MAIYEYKCDTCGKVKTEIRPVELMDMEKRCTENNCNGTLKKSSFFVGSVLGQKNVPNN